MNIFDVIKDEKVDEMLQHYLKAALSGCEDEVVKKALHVVIAYHSIPGTYMEGAYDGNQ